MGARSFLALAGLLAIGCGDVDGGNESSTADDDSVVPSAKCEAVGGPAAVAMPEFVANLEGNTGWYSSPAIVDLDGDGDMEIVAPFYDVFVYDHTGAVLHQEPTDNHHFGRVYMPGVVADLEGDGIVEIVVGGSNASVAAYEFVEDALRVKGGWPVTACNTSNCENVEVRGMSAGDLDRDGRIEIAVSTTETEEDGAQVFVFDAGGRSFEAPGTPWPDWPRYNTRTGEGGDADANGQGHQGYGAYGLNTAIGNIDDDAELEVIVTYDNHQINAFELDGTSIAASSYFSNRASEFEGMPLDWGQFIRYRDAEVEDAHYHRHEGEWPGPSTNAWLQWTDSPPVVADVDGDGDNEVLGVPNVEENEPYETIAHAVMVLEGAYGDGERSAMRLAGWDVLPQSEHPYPRGDGDWYPPSGVPAPSVANILGDARPEIVVPMNDGSIYAFGPDAQELWRFDYSGGRAKTYASEATIADLNGDAKPEILFSTYALDPNAGRLVVLGNDGRLLHDVTLPNQGENGNGIGGAAAPTVGDVDGDGALEVLVMTFDHGMDMFTIPGSSASCLLWPTGRGNLLRNGQGPAYVSR